MFKVNEEKCVGCAACVNVCPAGAISMSNDKAKIDAANCVNCGKCVQVCPQEAISCNRRSAAEFSNPWS